MMKKVGRAFLISAVIILLAGVGVTSWTVTAQDATFPTLTPPASPTNNGGSAQWEIGEQTFTSDYPYGFNFTLKAASSAGKIKNATVRWKLSPVALQRVGGTFNEQLQQWEFRWESTAGPVPAWVGLQYWFVLEDVQGNTYQTQTWQAEYADNTKSWGRAESEDIIVFWEHPIPDSFGQLTLEAMKEQREFYRAAWGSLLSYKPRAIFYATKQSYYEWDLNSGTVGRRDVGQTVSTWGGTVQYNYNGNLEEGAYGTILHEIAHLYQSDKRQHTTIGWWVEGQATFFEMNKGVMYDYLGRVKQIVRKQGLGSIRDSWGVATGGRGEYDFGYAFIRYLVETYGIEVHLRITELLRGNKNLFDAISEAVGKPLDEIEYDYRVWLGVPDPTVPTALPTLAFTFPPTPTFKP